MAAARQSELLAARDDDHDEVRCALTVASTMWQRHERDEAIRWLRRAAKAAADVDEVLRAVELSKALAEMEAGKPSAPKLRFIPGAGQRSAQRPSHALKPVAASPTAPAPAERRSTTPPPPPRREARRPTTAPPASGSVAPPRPRSKPPSEPPRPRSSPPRGLAPRSAPPAASSHTRLRPSPLPREQAQLPVDDLDEPTFVMADREAQRSGASAAPAPEPEAWRGARVAVVPRADREPLLMLLPSGASAPSGAALAWLVPATEGDAVLLARCLEPRP